MPTTLPVRAVKRTAHVFLLLIGLLYAACLVIELLDPAPTAVEASIIVSP